MKKLPAFLKQYFRDVDFAGLNLKKSRIFVLKRVLEHGNIKAVNWLAKYFSREDIKRLILTADDLSPKTANFWALYLNINPKTVPSLQKPHPRQKQSLLTSRYLNRILWPYP